jgi:hypothetical protein
MVRTCGGRGRGGRAGGAPFKKKGVENSTSYLLFGNFGHKVLRHYNGVQAVRSPYEAPNSRGSFLRRWCITPHPTPLGWRG